jgi:hypothetical protein
MPMLAVEQRRTSELFNGAYNNESVRFNVQDGYLNGEISEDGLTRAFTHMSIRCNPGAPKEVPEEVVKQLLAAAPTLLSWTGR